MFVTAILLLGTTIGAREFPKLLPNNSDRTKAAIVQHYLDEIASSHFDEEQLNVFLDHTETLRDLHLTSSTVVRVRGRQDTALLAPFHFRKVDAYVIVTDPASEDPSHLADFLGRTHNWNPRAKFVLVLETGDPADYFDAFSRIYALRVVILIAGSVGSVGAYVTEGGAIVRAGVSHKTDPFSHSAPKHWQDYTLRVALVEFQPYVYCAKCLRKRGLELYALRLLQDLLHFKITYVNRTYDNWGKQLGNGSFDQAYGDLEAGGADVALGFFHARYPENLHFDLSFPYMEDAFRWVVPSPARRSHWKSALMVFSVGIWALLLLLLALVASVFYQASKSGVVDDVEELKSVWGCFMVAYRCLLCQSVRPQPVSWEVRYVFTVWCFLGWIIVTAFQSNLMLYLNFDQYYEPIGSVRELIASRMGFGFFEEVAEFYADAASDEDRYVRGHYVHCDLGYACLNRTAFRKDFATVKSVKYAARTDLYVDGEDGKPMVHFVDENVVRVHVVMAFAKGHPVFGAADALLLQMKSAGFVDYFYDLVGHKDNVLRSKRSGSNLNTNTLTLDEVQGMFWLLLIGHLVAGLVFVAERLGRRRNGQ